MAQLLWIFLASFFVHVCPVVYSNGALLVGCVPLDLPINSGRCCASFELGWLIPHSAPLLYLFLFSPFIWSRTNGIEEEDGNPLSLGCPSGEINNLKNNADSKLLLFLFFFTKRIQWCGKNQKRWQIIYAVRFCFVLQPFIRCGFSQNCVGTKWKVLVGMFFDLLFDHSFFIYNCSYQFWLLHPPPKNRRRLRIPSRPTLQPKV